MCKRLPFSNRYVFAKVMQDNPDLCKEVIERILNMKIGRIRSIEVESEATEILYRGVRFDVFMQGDDAAFEVEMQTYEQEGLPLRMRYYRSQLDRRTLSKGDPFSRLKPVYVIFICLNDHFGAGLPVYTFKSTCREDPSVAFDNGACDIVLCADGDLSQTTRGIADLLEFVRTNKATDGDDLTGRLADAVEEAHRDEEWVRSMNMLDWDFEDARRAASAQGHAVGLAEGRKAGLAEGREAGLAEGREAGEASERARTASLMQKMQEAGCTAEEIVRAMQLEDRAALYERYAV